MHPEITSPKHPVAIRTEHIVDHHTTFRVQQHGKAQQSAKYTVFSPEDEYPSGPDEVTVLSEKAQQEKLKGQPRPCISVDGKYMARDGRHCFFDASGLPLFDLFHKPMGVTWHVEVPGGSGTPIARGIRRYSVMKDRVDFVVKNAAAEGEELTLHVRGQDIWKLRTNVYLGDKVVMTAKRTEKMSTYVPGMKIEWLVEIAAGMDMSLASLIVVILGADMYDSAFMTSSKKSS